MKSLSLRNSVIALAFCCVLGGQAISALVLTVVPYEAPRAMNLESALAAIGGQPRPGLEVRTEHAPPIAQTPRGYAQWLAHAAAVLLRRSPSDIRVHPLASSAGLRPNEHMPPPDVLASLAADPTMAGALGNVPFPPFELAIASPDGSWQIAGPVRAYLSREDLRILLSFAVAVACLAPLIWWNSRRLTRPLRFLAGASLALGKNPGMKPLHVEGPEEVQVATRAFNHMHAELTRHLSERATLVAAIAHDLRTPLTSLRIRAETAPVEERRKMAADINRLDALVSDMLVFARGARPDDPRVRVDLAALARSVVDDANDLGHTVPFVAAGPVWVLANASLLQRVLENLLSNALSYGQNVQVEVVRRDDQAEVHVTDEGPGLPDEALEQVFEPFFRLEASRSRKTGGTGLGLAIARAIARSHGGDVTVSNRKSGGLDACLSLTGLGDDRVGR